MTEIFILNEILGKIKYIFSKQFLVEIWCLLYSITLISLKYILLNSMLFISRTICQTCLFESVRVERAWSSWNVSRGGASYKSLGTSGIQWPCSWAKCGSGTMDSYVEEFDPRTCAFLLCPLLNRSCSSRNVFFSLLTIATPTSFENHPAPLRLHDGAQWDLTAQQYNAIDLSHGKQEVDPLLQHLASSITLFRITSKQVQNMVLHPQHLRRILNTT
jgi:hypothetical protein